jgi:fucose 4-O-acetylase-like acetyltransferase
MQHSRNMTVDVAKGIAGILVVLGHTLAFRYRDGVVLQLTHLTTPLYIFLSGVFFLPERPWLRSMLRLVDALLKPYFVVLLAWGCWYAAQGVWSWGSYAVGVLYATGASIALVPLWFLPHLFLCRIVGKGLLRSAIARQASNKKLFMIATIFWVMGCWLLDVVWRQPLPEGSVWQRWFVPLTHWPGLPFSADVLWLTLPCLLMGRALSQSVQHCGFSIIKWVAALILMGVAIYAGATFDINRRIIEQPAWTTVLVVTGLYSIVIGSAGILRWPMVATALSYFGRYFLLVLLLHLVVLRWVFKAVIMHLPDMDVWQTPLLFLVGILLSLLLIEVVRRNRVLSWLLLPLPRWSRLS